MKVGNNQVSIGGIVGYNYADIINSQNDGKIIIKNTVNSNIGGIVGQDKYEQTIYGCTNTSEIIGENIEGNIAGIIGSASFSIVNLINNDNLGNITLKSIDESTSRTSVAGICAYKNCDALLYNCINRGNITIEDATKSKNAEIFIAGILGRSNGSVYRLSNKLYNYGNLTVKNSASPVWASGCISNDEVRVGKAVNKGNIEINGETTLIISGINNGYAYNQSDMNDGEKINYGDIKATSKSGNVYVYGINRYSNNIEIKQKNYGNIYAKGQKVTVRGICGTAYQADYDECFNKGNITVEAYSANVSGLTEHGRKFKNCYNEGNIEILSDGDVECAGIAIIGGGNGANSNCYNSGNINIYSNGHTFVTGLIFDGSGIKDSYNKGNISVINNSITSMTGICRSMSSILNCYNVGNMNLVTTKSSYNIVSGISFNSNRPVNCYNEGDITVINGGESTWVDPIMADQPLRSCEFI